MPEAVAPAAPAVPAAPAPNGITPPPTPAAKAEAAKPAGMTTEEYLEYVVDGKQVRETKAEALKKLSKAGYADAQIKQAREALKAQRAREAQQAADDALLEQDEEEYLRKKGRDPEALARRILERKLKQAEMTPDQLAAEQARLEASTTKKELEKMQKEQHDQQVVLMTDRLQRRLETDLTRAAQAAEFPPGPESFAIIQALVQDHFDAGLEVDVGGAWAARIVDAAKDRIEGSRKHLTQAVTRGLKGQKLADWLGPDVVKEVLDYRLSQIRGKRAAPSPRSEAPVVTQPSQYITPAQASAQLRALRGGK